MSGLPLNYSPSCLCLPSAKASGVLDWTHYFEAVHSVSSRKDECIVGTNLELDVDIDNFGSGKAQTGYVN